MKPQVLKSDNDTTNRISDSAIELMLVSQRQTSRLHRLLADFQPAEIAGELLTRYLPFHYETQSLSYADCVAVHCANRWLATAGRA